jgi:hypothetical protein
MAGLKTRAYTTATFGFIRRPETRAPNGSPGQFAELIVPRRGATTAEILLKRTLQGVSIMGRLKDHRGTVFILRLAAGWKTHDILGHIGRHLPFDMRIKVFPLSPALAEKTVSSARAKAFIKQTRAERAQRTKPLR